MEEYPIAGTNIIADTPEQKAAIEEAIHLFRTHAPWANSETNLYLAPPGTLQYAIPGGHIIELHLFRFGVLPPMRFGFAKEHNTIVKSFPGPGELL